MRKHAELIIVLLIGLICLLFAEAACGDNRPDLFIVESDRCGPCVAFQQEFATNAELRRVLHDRFILRKLDWDLPSPRMQAERMGVRNLPAFVVVDRGRITQRVTGYSDPESLVMQLGIRVVDVQKIPAPTPPAEPRDGQRIDLLQQLHRTEDRLRDLTNRLNAEQVDNADLQSAMEAERSRFEREIRELRSRLHELSKQRDSPSPTVPSDSAARPPPATTMPRAGDREGEPSQGEGASPGISGILKGIGGAAALFAPQYAIPIGLATTVGGWLLGRWQRRRRGEVTSPVVPHVPQPTPAPPVIYQHQTTKPATQIHYQLPPPSDDLDLFRQGMKRVSDYYPSARPWVNHFEKAFTLMKSGEPQ